MSVSGSFEELNEISLKRKFVTNLVLIILLNLLIKPLWIFGIDRNVQIITGKEDFGMYATLLSSILPNKYFTRPWHNQL